MPSVSLAHALLRTVRFAPYIRGAGPVFTLRFWDTYRTDAHGRSRLGYRLTMRVNGRTTTVFDGCDFFVGHGNVIDSDDVVRSIMSFLTLCEHDTDSEYFEGYTAAQLAFRDSYAETLAGEVLARFGSGF